MSEKEFESITSNQIAAEANVNRGTGYLHFDDKYDLREQCRAAEITQLLRHCMSGDDLGHLPSKTALLHTFEYLEQHASFYSIMLKSKGSMVFRNQMETMFRKSLMEHLDSINLDQDR
ncbi:TetR/AcrR family transcriptional regulator, partial [Clostridium perfringens]|uniref:TetR/AcrR family transcriptional regulator n=1 Tax=Clostridium perfringens TaxID=1502 RepID=UPI002ACBFECB